MAGQSLRDICGKSGMPDKSTVFRWLAINEKFRDQYARAREIQQEHHAEELLDIADDGRNDWMASNDEENLGYKLNGEHIQRSRLRVDARKWLMSKLAPKRYGDKTQITGEDGQPIAISHVVKFISSGN